VESEMTQPAKLQEPSMEEILASIRRIIADDEAKPSEAKPSEVKPAAAEKPPTPEPPAKPEKPAAAAPAAKPPVMNDIPPSRIAAAQAAVAKAAPPPVAPPPAAPAASNSQDDIDAMLAGLDEATSEAEIRPAAPEAEVFELTDDMAVAPPEPPPQPSFHKIEPADDLEFT
jgi:cell pole-organizing protein PopZ